MQEAVAARGPEQGPHWYRVDGVVLPRPVGGAVALDFVNTYAGWGHGGSAAEGGEFLRGYDHLVVWAREAGLLDAAAATALRRRAAARTHVAEQVAADARRFRADLRTALLDPRRPQAAAAMSRWVGAVAPHVRLAPGTALAWEVGGGLERPLSAVVWESVLALTTLDLATVGSCPGPDCGWLFLDPSGRRRWCSMRSCGNRAKVAAHAERRRRSS